MAKSDVLYIGYPKAASTYLRKYLAGHPQVRLEHQLIAQILYHPNYVPILNPSQRVRVYADESIVESVCVTGRPEVWAQHLHKAGAFNLVAHDVVIDPELAAARLHKWFPNAKVLIVIRDPVTWFESVFKYVVSQLAPGERRFMDWWSSPQGRAMQLAAHHSLIFDAYRKHFAVGVLMYEEIGTEGFVRALCDFIGIEPLPLPAGRENVGNASLARLHQYLPALSGLPHPVKAALKPLTKWLPQSGPLLTDKERAMIREIYGVYPNLQPRPYAHPRLREPAGADFAGF